MDYKYRAICHTKCYWLDTLWEIGEIYDGDIPPNKHFSDDGKTDSSTPPPSPGRDPRPTIELKSILSSAPFNYKIPTRWSRKQIWVKLAELESLYARDELTTESTDSFECVCGFVSKSSAGLVAHKRSCEKHQEEDE